MGVLLTDQGDPMWRPFCRGLEDRLAAADYVALIGSTGRRPDRERTLLIQMRARHVEGLILADGTLNASLRAGLAGTGLPAVAAGSSIESSARLRSLPSVSVDMARGMQMVVAHLTALGHRSLACITGPGWKASQRDFVTAVTASGLAPQPRLALHAPALSAAEGARCCRQVLASGEPCTAIVTTSELLAAGCCQALAAAGRDCPEHLSVTGLGDLPLADCLTPPLTTIRPPQYHLGTQAAQMLLRRISGGDEDPAAELLLPAVVVRGSTAPAPHLPATSHGTARPRSAAAAASRASLGDTSEIFRHASVNART